VACDEERGRSEEERGARRFRHLTDTYVEEVVVVALLEIVQDRRLVEVREVRHVLDAIELGRVLAREVVERAVNLALLW